MRRSKLIFLFLLAACCLPIFAPAQTILLVRHAEKISEAPDATLSDIGRQRADRLARMLADAGITAIYTSEMERTKQTAAPLAKLLKLTPTVIPAKDIAGLLNKLRAAPDTAVVLVVGHSNTIPAITEQLLAAAPDGNFRGGTSTEMKSTDYDRLYIVNMNGTTINGVNLHGSDRPKLLVLHY